MKTHHTIIESKNRFLPLLLLCIAPLLAPKFAHAQRLLVVTQTLTTMGEAARLYVSTLDLETQQTRNDAKPLPGITAIGRLHRSHDGNIATLTSGYPWNGGDFTWRHAETFLTNMSTAPLRFQQRVHPNTFGQARQWVGNIIHSPTDTRILLLEIQRDEDNKLRGKLQSLPWIEPNTSGQSTENTAHSENIPTWHLEGPPVAVVSLNRIAPNQVAVLYAAPGGGAILATGDLIEDSKPTQTHTLGIIEHVVDTRPIALQLSHDGKFLCIIIAGFALDTPQGAALSWLYTIDVDKQALIGEPVPLLGEPNPRFQPLRMTHDNRCWIATRTPGTHFAYATRVRLSTDNTEKEIEYPMAGVENSFIIAPAPNTATVAVAIGKRLEIWPNGQRYNTNAIFENPINVLTWKHEGLFVAEAGRIHRVHETTGLPMKTVQLQTGHVTDLALLPPTHSSTQALDPATPAPPPPPKARPLVLLHGEAAGRELQVVRIDPNDKPNDTWHVTYDQETAPWLRIHVVSEPTSHTEIPYTGRGQGLIYMGAIPAFYQPNGILRATLNIAWIPEDQQTNTLNTQVAVRIIPPRSRVRRILWLRSDNNPTPLRHPTDPIHMRAIAQHLAAAPYRFSHHEVFSPFTKPLNPYTIVIINTHAITKGVITRQDIWQYVAEGGALLILGNHTSNDSLPTLARWLQPAGVLLNASPPISGTFTTTKHPQPLHHLNKFTIKEGLSINANTNDIQIPLGKNNEGAVFLARQYAYGRFAILAAPTPLQSNAIKNEENKTFATDLFQWLAIAGREFNDLDGDGLTDNIEDQNNNGRLDDGETDPLNPDTDNDGISDRMEDRNRNGRIDAGETDPRKRDSDGDGIFDGADATPAP